MLTNWKKGKIGLLMASAVFLLAACGGGNGDTTETGTTDPGTDTSAQSSEDTAGETGGDYAG